MMIRLLLALLLTALPIGALALNPLTSLQEYNRASWTAKDGAPSEVRSMAQTRDGALWMVGPFGLYRFDGTRFEQIKLPHSDNPMARRAWLIRAHPDGGLWISFAIGGGLSVLHPDGRLEEVVAAGKLPTPLQVAFDDNGDIWSVATEGLFRVRNKQVTHYGEAQGVPPKLAYDVRIDRYKRLWVLSGTGVHLYDRASDSFTQVRTQPINSTLIESPDGRIWTATNERVQALPAPADPAAKMSAPNVVNAPGFGSDWIARFDRDGNLWRLKCPNDLCVTPAQVVAQTDLIVAPPEAPDKLQQAPNATPMAGNVIIEDREHNIWVAGLEGIDRYRDNRMQRRRLSSSRATFMMAVDDGGQAWVADPYNNAIWKLKAGAEPERDPTPAWVVAKGRDGALLLPWKRDMEHRLGGKTEKIPLPEIPGPDGKPLDLTLMGLTDDGLRLWLVAIQTGLIIKRDGPWLPRDKYNLPPKILLGVPGKKPGDMWLACADGSIVLFDEHDKLTTYPAALIGQTTGIFTSHEIVAAGDLGVAVLQQGRFRPLLAADPEVLQNVSGLVVAPDGDRWLNGSKGLVHVRQADWNASMAKPDLPLRYQLFGAQDGYVGKAMLESRHPSAILDKDGQLWLASTGGILRFDTRNLQRNEIAPSVSVQATQANNANHPVRSGMQLPAGAQNFNISYAAVSLRQPESVRFQYRLDGTDNGWQDAGSRSIASYTNIAPGAYRFQVRAANEDGVWSEQPATLDFEVPATFTQTLWFKALCLLAATAVLYLLYWYRLRIVTARLEERMEVRLAERERIARTLHDTFLQSVQGVVLRLDAAVGELPGDSAAHKTLAPVLDSARASINEGRAQVHDLRSSTIDDLESRLRELAVLLAASFPGAAFALAVGGDRRPLRADIADDLSEIGREALRNAYQHAHANSIEVLLDYQPQQFTLTVRDNGQGMSPAPTAGHWGLVGMRERAARIGAALEISSTPAQGSRVILTMSAQRAYAGLKQPWWRRLLQR